MQQCERCGTNAAEGAGFCTSCGHRLHPADPGGEAGPSVPPPTYAGVLVPPDPGPRRRPWLVVAAGLAAVALVAAGFVVGRSVDDGDGPAAGDEEAAAGEGGDEGAGDPGPWPRLVPGDDVELEVTDGVATAELLVARSPGVVLRADEGTISVTDEAGETVADDADSELLDLGPGLYTVRVDDLDGDSLVLTAGELVDEPFPGNRALAGELSEATPLVHATIEPTASQVWGLVDDSADEVDAVVHDVTDLAGGEDPASDAPVVCDRVERECRLAPGRTYLLRIGALNLPAAYDLSFEELVVRSGPGSVLVDGQPAPQAALVIDGETVTFELAIGHRGDVALGLTPGPDVDVAATVDGREVDDGGAGVAEVVVVTVDEIEDAFGFLELEVTARGGSGVLYVTAERR